MPRLPAAPRDDLGTFQDVWPEQMSLRVDVRSSENGQAGNLPFQMIMLVHVGT